MEKLSTKEDLFANDFLKRLHSDSRPVLVFDGATGTALQDLELTSEDFGGKELEGCNEFLTLSKPEVVETVHEKYLKAGCDVIETNTFGANSIVLAEYNLQSKAYEINEKAAQIAKKLAIKFSTDHKPRFVAGSIGPTTKLPSLGHTTFDNLKDSYKEQILGLVDGGVDLLIIETCQDVLQIKSALLASNEIFESINRKVPLMVSVTMETTGTMLLGTDIAAVVSILEPFEIDVLGLNCATGPVQMKEHIKYLSQYSPFIISCIPNAGLPENIGGIAHYKLTPIELKMQLMHFVEDLGVQIIGGCCGTTPNHIKELSKISSKLIPACRTVRQSSKKNIRTILNSKPSAASIYSSTTYEQDNSFLIIGERLNASGSKKARELLNSENWDGLISLAKDQLKENAHLIDVNVDYVGRDGVKDMRELASRLVNNIDLPLVLDSTEWEKMESGLKVYGGKCLLNSTNYEDGNDRFYKVLSLAKNYGAGIVIGTIDEDGMARTSARKFAIAERAYKDCMEFGIPPHEIFYDPLALPISTGLEEDRRNAMETIDSIKSIKSKLKETHIVLGISNISFGLNSAARINLNSVFLNECLEAGLDSAIISPAKILPLNRIKDAHINICRDLIYDKRKFKESICQYDPLTKLTKVFEGLTAKDTRKSNKSNINLTIEERLKQHIIDGDRTDLEQSLKIALENHKALDIINNYLLDGMKVVGELFGSGQMQLPFVLQSAETMKNAVSFLEPFMDKADDDEHHKSKFLIATVKGDVHDIGKNLVDIILTNNGYEVINLGIKQDVNAIIEAQNRYNADCIAMSGLLVKSTAFMKDNLLAFNEAGIDVPVILGGAALTPKFVNNDCSSVYNGKIIYGRDAFTDLRFMDSYIKAKEKGEWSNTEGFTNIQPEGIVLASPQNEKEVKQKELNSNSADESSIQDIKISLERSLLIPQEKPVTPPFIGTKALYPHDIDLEDILFYLDRNALFSGQWQFRKKREQSRGEYDCFLEQTAEPILSNLIDLIQSNDIIRPSVVYGYFPCGRKGNDIIVFSPTNESKILGRFSFPRQKALNKYCISDYFCDLVDKKPIDYLPMQAVTVGTIATEYAQKLYSSDKYSDYLYFHGLAVQLAEALAELTHSRIRRECGFTDNEQTKLKDILAQRYRGARFSFGYPACPNVSDSSKQLDWLNAKRIGMSIDSSDQLYPEQSTTAIVALHSNAKYFSA